MEYPKIIDQNYGIIETHVLTCQELFLQYISYETDLHSRLFLLLFSLTSVPLWIGLVTPSIS
ncbi:hypothetical protein DSUL_60307 [Desulfovibrionales bacterium]